MGKQEFLDELRKGLSGLPRSDMEERLTFYGEMIDDRVEDGLTEDEAAAGIGTVNEVISQITAEIPLSRLVGYPSAWRRRRSRLRSPGTGAAGSYAMKRKICGTPPPCKTERW